MIKAVIKSQEKTHKNVYVSMCAFVWGCVFVGNMFEHDLESFHFEIHVQEAEFGIPKDLGEIITAT